MSSEDPYKTYENQIVAYVKSSLAKTNVFEALDSLFNVYFERSCDSITELRKRNTKDKGDLFEVFCMMYLRKKGYECWMLRDVPQDLLTSLSLSRQDVGVDLVARIPSSTPSEYLYFPVQCKYRNPTKDRLGRTVHRVGWKDISTFLAICTRTGPWTKHIIMTNALTVSWKGKKTPKDYTIARNTFSKLPNTFWCSWVSDTTVQIPTVEPTKPMVESKEDQRQRRQAWLDRLCRGTV